MEGGERIIGADLWEEEPTQVPAVPVVERVIGRDLWDVAPETSAVIMENDQDASVNMAQNNENVGLPTEPAISSSVDLPYEDENLSLQFGPTGCPGNNLEQHAPDLDETSEVSAAQVVPPNTMYIDENAEMVETPETRPAQEVLPISSLSEPSHPPVRDRFLEDLDNIVNAIQEAETKRRLDKQRQEQVRQELLEYRRKLASTASSSRDVPEQYSMYNPLRNDSDTMLQDHMRLTMFIDNIENLQEQTAQQVVDAVATMNVPPPPPSAEPLTRRWGPDTKYYSHMIVWKSKLQSNEFRNSENGVQEYERFAVHLWSAANLNVGREHLPIVPYCFGDQRTNLLIMLRRTSAWIYSYIWDPKEEQDLHHVWTATKYLIPWNHELSPQSYKATWLPYQITEPTPWRVEFEPPVYRTQALTVSFLN